MADNSASGAAVASGSAGGASNDREDLLDPILSADDDGAFKPLKTIRFASLHLVISTIISFVGIILAAVWPAEKRCNAYFIVLYLRLAFWLFTYLSHLLIKKHHNDLRMNGYQEFHRDIATLQGVPLSIVSLWNSMLLGVQALIHHIYGDQFWVHCLEESILSPIAYVTAFNVAETIVLAAFHFCYISKVRKFNKAAHPPDVLRGENNTSGSLGLMQPGGSTSELLEKQADLIGYLKYHNQKLNQKLHQMQLHARTVNITN